MCDTVRLLDGQHIDGGKGFTNNVVDAGVVELSASAAATGGRGVCCMFDR